MVRGRFAAAGLAVAFLLSACSGAGNPDGQSSSDIGFIEGAGTVFTKAPADRADAPTLEGAKLGGGTLSMADYRGKIVVVNVWGAWCSPCRKEMPDLIASSKELAKYDVSFVGINTGEGEASALAYVRAAGIPYPSFYDPERELLLNLRDSKIPPKAIPSTLVLDPQGRVAAGVIGGVTQQALSKIVGKVVLEQVRATAKATEASTSGPSATRSP